MGKLGVVLLKGTLKLLSLIPLQTAYKLSGGLTWLIRDVVRYRKDVVMVNLARCFPEKSYDELRSVCKEFYRHLTDIFVEAVWYGGCNPKRFYESGIMKIVNPELTKELIDNTPSVMVMLAHTGNWELIGGFQALYNEGIDNGFRANNVSVVYRKLSNAAWDKVMKDNRISMVEDKDSENNYIESKNIMRYAVRHRNEKRFYMLNTDQRPYFSGSDNMTVSFMGQDCRTMHGAASLANKLHMSVCYMSMKRKGRGHYSIEFIPICRDASEMEPKEIMTKYYALVEEDIRLQPENYLWTHKRWQ